MLYSIFEAVAPAFIDFVFFMAFVAVCAVIVMAAKGAGLDRVFPSLFSEE